MCFVSITSGFVPLISALFILLHKGNYKYAALYFIGEISYSLYLIHIPVSTFFIDKVHTFIGNPIILFGGSLVVSILAAYIFNMIIERPSIKLSKLIKLK